MNHRHPVTMAAVLTLALAVGCASQPKAPVAEAAEVRLTELAGRLRIDIRGEFFSEYHFQEVPRPFFYPVLGPTGLAMTRNWPMREAPDEEHDHVHHRSLWFTHGDVNGQDFWSESDKAGRIVHDQFLQVQSGRVGIIRSRNKWVAKDGTVVCTDERTHRIQADAVSRWLDFEITVKAGDRDLVFGDTKEGSMAIRVAETMRVAGKVGRGHIVNSEGVRDAAAWSKRAKWCDYFGPVENQTVGVAIFDHPQNPRHPTWWHVRDYGLFAANPFGVHDFERQPAGTGNLTVPAGQTVTFRYRFYFHRGDDREGRVAERYQEYVAPTLPTQ